MYVYIDLKYKYKILLYSCKSTQGRLNQHRPKRVVLKTFNHIAKYLTR